jgi:hypothetical protein
MTELLEKMKNILDGLGDVTITEEDMVILDDMRRQMKHLQGKRTDWQFAYDTDCVFLEELLIRRGLVEPTLLDHRNERGSCVYDCRIKLLNSVAYVDFKCVDKECNFNLGPEKFKKKKDGKTIIEWVQDGVVKGLLTDYCFYRMHRPERRPLQVGDVVRFELINVLNSRFVLKSLNDSVRTPGGKFYKVEKYV